MLRVIKRRFAIRDFRKKLGPYLERQFGWQAKYSPQQVRSGTSALHLSFADICYAYAMFCTQADFDSHHAASGEQCDYETMHAEAMSFGTGSQGESPSHHDSGGGSFDSHSHDSGGSDGGGGDGGSD